MTIGGIGNTGADYTQYSSRQLEQQTQQQESLEQQVEKAVTVRQKPQSQDAGANSGSNGTAQSYTSSVAEMSNQIAQQLQSGSDDDNGEQTLINKANSGAALTQSELSRLKEVDAALYTQVVKAEKAREELRIQMSINPSSANQAAHSAISRQNNEGQELIRRVLNDEYNQFASKYDQVNFSKGIMR